jgi:hypothetical protein
MNPAPPVIRIREGVRVVMGVMDGSLVVTSGGEQVTGIAEAADRGSVAIEGIELAVVTTGEG